MSVNFEELIKGAVNNPQKILEDYAKAQSGSSSVKWMYLDDHTRLREDLIVAIEPSGDKQITVTMVLNGVTIEKIVNQDISQIPKS